jgi:hypothetical protein
MTLLLCAALSGACSKESVVTNAPAQSASSTAPTAPTPAQAEPAASVPATAAATPNAVTAAATPSQTPLPVIKQAQAQPGVPVAAPEIVKRPLSGAELEKALQQLPPEVRARIQGMSAGKPQVSPQPTKKP